MRETTMAKFDHYEQGTPSWVELMTPDQGAAREFYGGLFGWGYDDTDMGEMGHYYVAQLDGDDIGGIGAQMPGMEGHPAYWGVYLAVDDVDAATAKVEAAGGKIEAGPMDVMDNGRMSAIQDPTGARVGLWQAKQTIGTQRANEPGTPTWNECVTGDVKAAAGFYAEVLGMGSEDMDMGEAGSYTLLKNADGRQIGGAMDLGMFPEGTPAHWNVYFNVEDVDASVAKAEQLGAKTAVPAMDVPGVGRMAMVADPHGATFWVMAAADAA
jgi:predicted enzyme related to lactoylglutathione lyase